jgi:hypothetical protein
MDSDQKRTVIVVVLFLRFLLGLLELGKALDPYTMQTTTFRGEERKVAVYTNRRVVSIGSFVTRTEISGQIALDIVAVPRRGILAWTRVASPEEAELFHRFF